METNYELVLAEKWWSELKKEDKIRILTKLKTNNISDYFLPMVWKLELWLTEEDIKKKISFYKAMIPKPNY